MDGSRDIAVVVITHNRVHLLQQCVERVLARTSGHTREIVIWDNASSDGTRAYLDSLGDPRLDIVHHSRNIGQNAYAEAFERTSSSYLVEVDDDVVEAPENWDHMLLEAFERIPNIGFLAADLVDDENDQASVVRHHLRADQYRPIEIEGVELLEGPAGGGCAMTSRAVYVEAGGFPQKPRQGHSSAKTPSTLRASSGSVIERWSSPRYAFITPAARTTRRRTLRKMSSGMRIGARFVARTRSNGRSFAFLELPS